jgi:hypothetical protein
LGVLKADELREEIKLEGIHVPLHLLMPSTQSLVEVCRDHFFIGLNHFTFKWIHPLFAIVLCVLLPSHHVFKSLLYYTFGQVLTLIMVDVGLSGLDLLFTDLLGAIPILLLSYAALREKNLVHIYL